jgi:hypothetical protein
VAAKNIKFSSTDTQAFQHYTVKRVVSAKKPGTPSPEDTANDAGSFSINVRECFHVRRRIKE